MNALNDRLHSILLIGSGRLAKHLFYWNSLLEKPNQILTWDRSQDPHLLNKFLNQTTVVWLAISDAAIVPFFEKYLVGHDNRVVHFSGALHDPRLISAHPMMSFPSELMSESAYAEISFGITGASDLAAILPGFKNSFFVISAENKALYHSLCVVAGNFPQLLWVETEKKFSELQVPEKAFRTYITQVLNNYLALKKKSLTGPLIRKDVATVEKNQAALSGSKLKSIYHAFVKEFMP
ncbi:MAG: DUF2520 domain-containing protein [Bdellovibrio sp.]|nr:DUF2520 domain-containing protein [Bdellovibrio sp.]